MLIRPILTVAACIAIAGAASAQPRRASITGGGGDRGKCTIEVVVDDVAEVEIRGDSANLRTLAGRPAQWRRFICNGVMPSNPAGFRFRGIDGRGRQELVRDPGRGGAAVVRIEDRDGGAEGYTFDIEWSGGFGGGYGGGRDQGAYPGDRERRTPDDRFGGRLSPDDAVRVCQDAARRQAQDRYNARNISFRRTSVEDNPGPRDRVSGELEVRRGGNRFELYRFFCSVDFERGRVRTVQVDPLDETRR